MDLERTLKSLRKIKLADKEEEVPFITDEPKIPSFICFPNTRTQSVFSTEKTYGQGFDREVLLARIKSRGEFFERLCLYNPNPQDFKASKFYEDGTFIDPRIFYCYSEEQTPNKVEKLERRKEGIYRWFEAQDIIGNKRVYIPSQLIFLSPIFQDEFALRKEQISTGAAFGPADSEMAFKSGLLEVIERDACISSYLKKVRMKRVANLPDHIESLKKYIERYNLQAHIFDVTTDLAVPSIMAITIDSTGVGNAVNVGSKSALSYSEAIIGALMESVQCRRSSRIFGRIMFNQKPISEDEIISLEDRFVYWSPKQKIADLSYLLDSAEEVVYADIPKKKISLDDVVNSMTSRGYNLFVADITLPEIRNAGFQTLKVVIPELHPLYLDERAKSLYSVHHGEIKDDKTLKPHPIT